MNHGMNADHGVKEEKGQRGDHHPTLLGGVERKVAINEKGKGQGGGDAREKPEEVEADQEDKNFGLLRGRVRGGGRHGADLASIAAVGRVHVL